MNTEVCTITVSYHGTTLLSKSVENSFTIGEDPKNDFIVSGFESLPIVTRNKSEFVVHSGANDLCEELEFKVEISRPEPISISRNSTDKSFLAYFFGTSIIVTSFFTLFSLVPNEALSFSLEDDSVEPKYARYLIQTDLKEDIESKNPEIVEISEDRSLGKRSSGNEGSLGNPKSKTSGRLSIKGSSANHQLSRTFDPNNAARSAGILGILASQEGHFLASLDGGPFTVGQDDTDIWGSVTGTNFVDSHGSAGLGLIGTGRMGGGAEGLVGIGQTGLISKNPISQTGSLTGFGPKSKKIPTVSSIGKIETTGLDRDVVRRVVRAHINEVRSCYNAGLSKNPNLEGRVSVQFTILPTGKISNSLIQENTTKDDSLGNCIAKTIKRWKFPSSKGTSIVTYPFRLNV